MHYIQSTLCIPKFQTSDSKYIFKTVISKVRYRCCSLNTRNVCTVLAAKCLFSEMNSIMSILLAVCCNFHSFFPQWVLKMHVSENPREPKYLIIHIHSSLWGTNDHKIPHLTKWHKQNAKVQVHYLHMMRRLCNFSPLGNQSSVLCFILYQINTKV